MGDRDKAVSHCDGLVPSLEPLLRLAEGLIATAVLHFPRVQR